MVPSPANPQSLNRYGYVLNSPLRYTDPSGHKACDSFDAAGKCIPLPKMPTFWVSYAGDWDTTSQYVVQAGVVAVGSALAGVMNSGRHQDNLTARKSGDPFIPRSRVTAKQAFYHTYGHITFVQKNPGTVDG